MNYTYKNGLIDGIPIALGYLFVSVGFGISAVNLNIPVIHSIIISLTNLTSAGQVAGIQIIASCTILLTSAIEMFLTQLIINVRYSLMGIALSQKLDNSFNTKNRLLCSFFITDEVFAVASSKEKDISNKYMYGLGTLPIIGWTLGTAIGAILASTINNELSAIFSIAIYGMFLSIFIPPARKEKGVLLTISIAILISTIIYYFLPTISSGFSVIISSLIAAIVASLLFPKEDKQ